MLFWRYRLHRHVRASHTEGGQLLDLIDRALLGSGHYVAAWYWRSSAIGVDVVIGGSKADAVIVSNNSAHFGSLQSCDRPTGSSPANHRVWSHVPVEARWRTLDVRQRIDWRRWQSTLAHILDTAVYVLRPVLTTATHNTSSFLLEAGILSR